MAAVPSILTGEYMEFLPITNAGHCGASLSENHSSNQCRDIIIMHEF